MHPCQGNKTVIHNNKIIVGCEECLSNKVQAEFANKSIRDWQRGEYRKDLIQKNQPRDFVRAFGVETARKNGYSEEQIRKYS